MSTIHLAPSAHLAPAASAGDDLAQEVLSLRRQVHELRRENEQLQRLLVAGSSAPNSTPSTEALERQSQAWDLVLGIRSGSSTAKATAGSLTMEDRGAKFMHRHSGKIWLALFALWGVVIAVKEGWL